MRNEHVRKILRQYRKIKSLAGTYSALNNLDPKGVFSNKLQQKIDVIDSWVVLLSEEDRFVIEKHIFEQIAMPMVVVEYEARFGIQDGKCDRTLKRYQKRAINKIARFIESSGFEPTIMALFASELTQDEKCPASVPVLTLLENRKMS